MPDRTFRWSHKAEFPLVLHSCSQIFCGQRIGRQEGPLLECVCLRWIRRCCTYSLTTQLHFKCKWCSKRKMSEYSTGGKTHRILYFTAVNVHIVVFCIVKRAVLNGCQRFGETYCLHFHYRHLFTVCFTKLSLFQRRITGQVVSDGFETFVKSDCGLTDVYNTDICLDTEENSDNFRKACVHNEIRTPDFVIHSGQKVKAVYISEPSSSICQVTRCHKPEGQNMSDAPMVRGGCCRSFRILNTKIQKSGVSPIKSA